MLRGERHWMIMLLLLIYTAIAEGVSYVPDPSPCLIEIQGYKSAYYEQHEKGCAPTHVLALRLVDVSIEGIHRNHDSITAVSTIFIAIFTLTLWRSTHKMWLAGEQQINVAKK